MRLPICEILGVEYPLVAFSHCRDVVAAVTNAGGLGVLGAAGHTPDELEIDLSWIDAEVAGRSYGVDIVIADSYDGKGGALDFASLSARVPQAQRDFAAALLREHEIDPPTELAPPALLPSEENGAQMLDICFRHPIRLIANALGVPPTFMIERAKAAGVPVAALVGSADHAVKQVAAGVDLIVAQGTEAGGHCGEVTTFVLVPEVVAAVNAATAGNAVKPVPVLAAGGIINGRQMAAALALGAAGAWTGSVWLTTVEADIPPFMKRRLIESSPRDAVRTRSRTGKHCRQLRSDWTLAWDDASSPAPLPMPLQSMVSEPALRRVDLLAQKGHVGAQALATTLVGQGVGLLTRTRPAREVVSEMVEEFLDAISDLSDLLDED